MNDGKPCRCVTPHGYPFNQHPDIKCRRHPPCPLRGAHTRFDSLNKTWIFPDHTIFQLGAVIQTNGIPAYRVRCVGCGKESGEIKRSEALTLIAAGVQYVWTREPYAHNDTHMCGVKGCNRTDVEWHHWAPRSIFKKEADNWPVTPLCVACHKRWHDMTGVAT